MIDKLLIRFNNFLNPKRMAYAWFTGVVLWIAWLLSVFLGPGNMDLANQVIGTDYLQFYTAGMTLRLGESTQLYNFEYQAQLEMLVAGPELVNFHAYITPPFLAFLFVPLSYLPYTLSFIVWSFISLICLYLSLGWLCKCNYVKTFTWSLTFFPIFATISFGQNSLLSLAILSLSYFLWRKRSLFFAGLVSGLILYKPQLVSGIALIWLLEWRRDWKALLGLLSGGVILAALSIGLMPQASQAYLDITRAFLPTMLSMEQFPLWHAHTWRAFWFLLIPGSLSIAELLGLIFSLAGLFFFLLFWRNHHKDEPLLFAAAVCLTLWISPHAMIYDWALLLIPAILLWHNKIHYRHIWRPLFASLWVALLISGPLTVYQVKVLPIAIQISLPIFSLVLYIAHKTFAHAPTSFLSQQGDSINNIQG